MNYASLVRFMKKSFGLHSAIVLLLLLNPLSGCVSEDSESEYDGPIDLVIYFSSSNGVITESTQGGTQVSSEDYSIEFDFSNSSSSDSNLATFYANAGDGSNDVEIDASESASITLTWATHGLFNVTLGATDDNENSFSVEVKIRVEKRFWHNQTNTNNPLDNDINAQPDNDGPNPKSIVISSTVENPSSPNPLTPGTDVSISWSLTDSDGEEISSGTAQIGDGQSETWEFVVLEVDPSIYTLSITREQGNDSLNIQNDIQITYENNESPSNPFE